MRFIASCVIVERSLEESVFEPECLNSCGRMNSAAKAISRIGRKRRMSMAARHYRRSEDVRSPSRRAAFSFSTSGRTSSLKPACSKSASQRSGVISG